MGDQDNKDLVQGYIDKIYNALLETGKTINRVLLLLVFFSFAIIALSIGIVSISQDIPIFGLKFTIPSWLILLGGSAVIGALDVYVLTLSKVNSSLQHVVSEFYANTKLMDEGILLQASWNIVSPNMITVITFTFLNPIFATNNSDKRCHLECCVTRKRKQAGLVPTLLS